MSNYFQSNYQTLPSTYRAGYLRHYTIGRYPTGGGAKAHAIPSKVYRGFLMALQMNFGINP